MVAKKAKPKTTKNMGKIHKESDRTTSLYLSSIAVRQLEELQLFTGENASRVIIRAITTLYDKHSDAFSGKPTPTKDLHKGRDPGAVASPDTRTISIRMSPIAYSQLEELQGFTGENASRIIIRAIDELYKKYSNRKYSK